MLDIEFIKQHGEQDVRPFAKKEPILLKSNLKIAEVRFQLRSSALWEKRKNKEEIVYLYVVDPNDVFISVLNVDTLATAADDVTLDELINSSSRAKPICLEEGNSLIIALELMAMHQIASVPIVTSERKILGILDYQCLGGKPNWTLIREQELLEKLNEASEDLNAISGFNQDAMKKASMFKAFLLRSPWLTITLIVGGLCALLLHTSHPLSLKYPLLFCFLPLQLAIADAVCHQANCISIAECIGAHLSRKRLAVLLAREFQFCVLLGFLISVILATFINAAFNSFDQGMIIGLAIFLSTIVAGLIGLLTPICITNCKGNPDSSSGPIALGLTDLIAVVILISLACMQ